MFGETYKHNSSGSNGNNSIIKSGYDVTSLGANAEKLKATFHDALAIRDIRDANEESTYQYTQDAGALNGLATQFKHWSKAKIKTGQAALRLRQAVLGHQQQAAQLEIGWEQSGARHLQQMSDKLIQLGIVENDHKGFTQYCDVADRLLKGI
ncbi:hypothetical protein ELBI_52 [Anabaena phage Elbi]|nr:hypothetical protein ELBI_52 [Anabaena phage Elbi]